MIAPGTHKRLWHNLTHGLLLATGFILSPLSWWNDAVINIPLAYLFSWPFTLINERWFLTSFVFGYWLTNLLGFLMLHWGGSGIIRQRRVDFTIKQSFIISAIYSVLVIALVLTGWLPPPTEVVNRFH